MYLYDQGRISGVPLGIGRLGDFGNSSKKTKPDPTEAQRLEGEIVKHDAKKNWSGVDRTYEEWLKVRDETDNTKWQIHQKAAYAAMMLGKAGTRYKRLWTALALLKLAQGPSEERDKMKKEIKLLGDNWAHVYIRLTRGSEASVVPADVQSVEGGSEAIKWAEEKLGKERLHNGLLPLGRFIISGQRIDLGINWAWSRVWTVNLIQKMDGSFGRIIYHPRGPTSEVDPPLYQYTPSI
jgi:hypothetical protein